jgi:hypothetical protein
MDSTTRKLQLQLDKTTTSLQLQLDDLIRIFQLQLEILTSVVPQIHIVADPNQTKLNHY